MTFGALFDMRAGLDTVSYWVRFPCIFKRMLRLLVVIQLLCSIECF
jgi:hypothetical protein